MKRTLAALSLMLWASTALADTNLPFSPLNGATAGKTVVVAANATPTSVAGTITANASNILVTNGGSVLAFVRVSAEATPTATSADIPVPPNTSILIENPNQPGATGLAAISSATTAVNVYFTPGEGGK